MAMVQKGAKGRAAGRGVVLVLISVAFVFPFVWMLLISLRRRVDILTPGNLLAPLTLDNYRELFASGAIVPYFTNSVIVAVVNTAISLVVGTFVAYGFARYQWKQRESRAFFILSQRFLPPMAVVIPFFLLATLTGLIDTVWILVICYTLFNIPFTVWMMRGFIEDIPFELEEAAFVDGASRLRAIRTIVFPLIRPGMVATAIFCLINSWNEFVFAMFLTVVKAKTVPTSVMMYLTVSGVKWGEMTATGVLAAVPVLIFAISVQKHMIRGMTFGAVKG
jgi:multiple sugar transport system permease protein